VGDLAEALTGEEWLAPVPTWYPQVMVKKSHHRVEVCGLHFVVVD